MEPTLVFVEGLVRLLRSLRLQQLLRALDERLDLLTRADLAGGNGRLVARRGACAGIFAEADGQQSEQDPRKYATS